MDQNCIFCRIIAGQSPSEMVYEDDQVVAFLDLNPAAPIHVLIVPRDHIPSINHITSDQEALIGHLFTTAKQLADSNGIAKSGYRLIMNSGPDALQTVFHIHLHLLGGGQMRFPMG
jgi:histidine triad (HIT) family protein